MSFSCTRKLVLLSTATRTTTGYLRRRVRNPTFRLAQSLPRPIRIFSSTTRRGRHHNNNNNNNKNDRIQQRSFPRNSSSSRNDVYDQVRQVLQRAKEQHTQSRQQQQQQRQRPSRTTMSPVERILSAANAVDVDKVPSSSSSSSPREDVQQQDLSSSNLLSVDTNMEDKETAALTSFAQVATAVVTGRRFRKLHTAQPATIAKSQPLVDYLQQSEPMEGDGMPRNLHAMLRDILRDILRNNNNNNNKNGVGTNAAPTISSEDKDKSENNKDNNNNNDDNDNDNNNGKDNLGRRLRDQVLQQRQDFIQHMGWTEQQYRLMTGGLNHMSGLCAKHGLGEAASIVWNKVQETGFSNKEMLHALLHATSTFLPGNRRKRALYGKYAGGSILQILDDASSSKDGSSNAQSDDDDQQQQQQQEDLTDIVDEIAIYHDLQFEPTEQTLLVRSRLLIAQGKAHQAEDLLNRYSTQTALHLRAFLPLLRMYLDQNDLGSALRVYQKMRGLSRVHMDAETYVNLIAGTAERGGFHPSTPPIQGVVELGFHSASGPGLLDEMIHQMKQDILEIPTALARRLHNAFADGFPDSGVEKLTTLAPLKIKRQPMQDNDRVLADLVLINPHTGKCTRSGVGLRLEHLTENQVERLKDGVLSLASNRLQEFVNNLPRKPSNAITKAEDSLMSFFNWLDRREGEPFTVIIDGANVGYFMQNFESGRFSYHQIEFVMKSLEKAGERPLIVIPRKYTLDFFSITVGSHSGVGTWKQRLTTSEKRIRNELIKSDNIAVIPPGHLDDYFWILASVSQQTKSRKGRDLTVLPGDPSGRWPGTRPVLITNDQMRDHKLGMLEPMLFRRWFSNYIVNYNFPAFVGGECSHPEIGFSPASFFSREIQQNLTSDGSKVWHFPISDQQDVWFCLGIRDENVQEENQPSSAVAP